MGVNPAILGRIVYRTPDGTFVNSKLYNWPFGVRAGVKDVVVATTFPAGSSSDRVTPATGWPSVLRTTSPRIVPRAAGVSRIRSSGFVFVSIVPPLTTVTVTAELAI